MTRAGTTIQAAGDSADAEAQPGHLDLILQQIDALPTLSPVARRIMAIAGGNDVEVRRIAQVISGDPALSGKLLALCRRADKGVSTRITTVDRAAVLLGLEAVQAALLSVEVFEALGAPSGENGEEGGLDRRELWRHCLAVACASELIAENDRAGAGGFRPQEAFLAGLLHDLGKIALDTVLPQAFARVAVLCEKHQRDIAEVERRVIGLDHHAAGKRLAEHWGLPHALQDVIWLHGQPREVLPPVAHRPLIGVVSVADTLARTQHLGWSGNFAPAPDAADQAKAYGLTRTNIARILQDLPGRVADRARELGLDDGDDSSLLISSLGRANRRLGQLHTLLEQRAGSAVRHERALDAMREFLARCGARTGFGAVLAEVARSAAAVLGPGEYSIVFQTRPGSPWLVHRLGTDGNPIAHSTLEPPEGAPLSELTGSPSVRSSRLVSWLAQHLPAPGDAARLRLLALPAGEGLAAILLHERTDVDRLMGEPGLSALASTWGAALASAARHDGARRLSEQVADVNRRLIETQTRLVEASSMARLGELTAGAAHELNNPLTVISGQCQMLERSESNPEVRAAARAIVTASEKLTALISNLHLLADPPKAKRTDCNIVHIAEGAARLARERAFPGQTAGADALAAAASPIPVRVVCERPLPPVYLDRDQVSQVIMELVLNALQAQSSTEVVVRLGVEELDGRLCIDVEDDGEGMSQHALKHAFDPFFSELPAGRRTGLGLTRARRYVDLHGGEVILERRQGKGTRARVLIPNWKAGPADVLAERAA